MAEIQSIKQRFGIIGNSPLLDLAIKVASQVAPTDISVLISGESGTGKEVMPQIIHNYSHRKHNKYIAVNCGAIPEGTIDSEFFGHEKGAFTGASDTRKGYFEMANGGTIFLDEVAEMPLQTQVRLLRVLETGEFIKVGSSKVQKTDVRIVAATNKDIPDLIRRNKFREDLYYRLNTVPITLPPLRARMDDILLIFRKFAVDFSDKYRMPPIKLDESAQELMKTHTWPGNIRQLRNLAEQMSVIEKQRDINADILRNYLPSAGTDLPMVIDKDNSAQDFSEREILYKVLFDMKNDMSQLKALVADLMKGNSVGNLSDENEAYMNKMYQDGETTILRGVESHRVQSEYTTVNPEEKSSYQPVQAQEMVEESLSLAVKEKELIIKALEKHNNKRKHAAKDLGISERTLYRKIKEYDID
jgi:transcriptional regulator with PAS, ATPase and Fis domain